MAEQEACTELVDKASRDQIGTTLEGESQLLPLLQGLLEAPDNEQTADSGTESGEDQRSGLIAEVQSALDKLSTNLRDDATDITPERRSSLLQLVTKLQAGLAASVPLPERRSSVQGRFRRRQRPNRHTVGVSSEELADARRLIEEISLHELTPQTSRTKISILQKQNSEGSVEQNTQMPSFKPFQKCAVKNAVAKPFSSSNSTVSGNSSSVQTPTEPSESLDLLFNEEGIDKKPNFSYRSISLDDQSIQRSSSGDVSVKSIQHAVQNAAARRSTENLLESEETDEDTTMKAQTMKDEQKIEPIRQPHKETHQPEIIMRNNPIYQTFTNEEKSNKFNTRKLKMKRANTIDIPKPLNFYEDDADSDGSLPDEDYQQRRRSNYLALRGPIRVGNSANKNALPVFEAKTDNDKKFLAFINKHNENKTIKNETPKSSLWAKPEPTNQGSIWNNKFGNIKNAFEKASEPVHSQNSARQFWKSADDAISSGPKYDGPKISKQSARNLRQMFEEKQKQSQKLPWSTQNDKNIVTGSLKVKAFEPHNDKAHKFVPQPLPVNKFSHAPQSAFKPIPKKAPPPNLQISKTPIKSNDKSKDLDSPLFLYSPKPPNESSLKPWASNPGESRVLSLAAKKFENVPPPEPSPIKPRKLSKDKVTLPFHPQTTETLSAPYLVKSAEQRNNTVKQLSGQYNNLEGKSNDCYATYSTVTYTSPHHQQQSNYTIPSNNQYSAKTYQHKTNEQYNRDHANQDVYNKALPSQQHHHHERSQISSQFKNPQPMDQNYYPTTAQKSTYQESHQNPTQYAASSKQYYPEYNYQSQHEHLPQTQYLHPQGQHFNSATESYFSRENVLENLDKNYKAEKNISNTPHQVYSSRSQDNHHNGEETLNKKENYKQPIKPPNDYYYSNKQEYNEPQYTSTYQYQPQIQSPPTNYTEKSNQPAVKSDFEQEVPQALPHPPKLDSQVSVESVKEYNAVNSRVMTGPVSQQATTIRQKSPMNRDEHEIAAALNLRNALQKVSPKLDSSPQKILNNTNNLYNKEAQQNLVSPTTSPDYKTKHDQKLTSPVNYRSEDSSPRGNNTNYQSSEGTPVANYSIDLRREDNNEDPPKIMSPTNYSYKYRESTPRNISPHSFSYRPREQTPKQTSPQSFSYKTREPVSSSSYNCLSGKRSLPIESLEINDNGESIVTSKFQIPVINVPEPESPRHPTQVQIANKADSWNQICMKNQQPLHKPSPRASPNARTVSKSKSSHSLALPKQFEAGMTKDEMAHKRKTMEAFLGGDSKSPQSLSRASSNENLSKFENKTTKRTINRLKTSEKVSAYRHSSGLSRSRTLPDMVCPELLDETNVDKAFEELFKSST